MESKIRISYGNIDIEYEGSEDFLKQEFSRLLHTILELFPQDATTTNVESNNDDSQKDTTANDKIEGTTNTIATKLDVKSGPELILAAAAQLTFVQKQDKFHRKDLLKNMQSASNYYKKSYSGNFSKYLDHLVKKNKLTEQSKDIYAIPADIRREMEAALVK